jgi:hypothetical protein
MCLTLFVSSSIHIEMADNQIALHFNVVSLSERKSKEMPSPKRRPIDCLRYMGIDEGMVQRVYILP